MTRHGGCGLPLERVIGELRAGRFITVYRCDGGRGTRRARIDGRAHYCRVRISDVDRMIAAGEIRERQPGLWEWAA